MLQQSQINHFSCHEDEDQYLQRTNPTEKKLLEVLDCIWGGPLPLTSNIPKRLLQTACELVPEASQWQSAGNSR